MTLFTHSGVVRPSMQSFSERFELAFIDELKDFITRVQYKQPGSITMADGIQALRIAEACKQSAESGSLIAI